MESTPLFSVLCVCWNEGAFLAEGIRSVLRQSEPSLELILVDDHSTDTTWEIMSAAAKEDPRVVILRNPTKGKVAGFNAAVALSKGQWIHLLGGDDMLALTCLEACRKVIEASGPSLSGVYHDYTILNKETGEEIGPTSHGHWLEKATIAQSWNKKYGIAGGFFTINAHYARTILWPQPTDWHNEDTTLAASLKVLGTVKYLPTSLYYYRLSKSHYHFEPTLASHRKDLVHYSDGLKLFRERWNAWTSLPTEALNEAERHIRHADLLSKSKWSVADAWRSDLGFRKFSMTLFYKCDERLFSIAMKLHRKLRNFSLGFKMPARG
jgi:glycosyltransferase involved in cell wall biosynthesis